MTEITDLSSSLITSQTQSTNPKTFDLISEISELSQSHLNIKNQPNTNTCNDNLVLIESKSTSNQNDSLFSVGDKVRIDVTLDAFKQMQEGHGGWNQKMSDVGCLDFN